MNKAFFSILAVFMVFTYSCKKEQPKGPKTDFSGCKITNITNTQGNSKLYGKAMYYSDNQLYSYHKTDTNGIPDLKSYYRFKFSGSQLVEYGEVSNENYIIRRSILYDDKGHVTDLRWFNSTDRSRSINHRLYYNSNGWCSYILCGTTTVVNGVANITINDSIVFFDYTPEGYPGIIENYSINSGGIASKSSRLKFEYDAHGNVMKQYAGFNDKLNAEYEYDLNNPYNSEYIELQEALLLSTYLIYSNGLLPRHQIGKYPITKQTSYDHQGLASVYNFQNTFDNSGRFITQTVKTAFVSGSTSFNYSCK